MKIYISGKMTGLPDLGRGAFAEAERQLTANGHIAINPGVLPAGLDNEDYMPICLAMLDAADVVYMLRNWEDSPGAALEMRYAKYQGKRVFFAESPEDCDELFYGTNTKG